MAKALRKTLGSPEAPQALALAALTRALDKRLVAAWSLREAGGALLSLYERRRPGDMRPRQALEAAGAWLRGEVKLPLVRRVILGEAHAAARELDSDPSAQAAARAIAQAASTIHAAGHALGLAFYGAAAFAYDQMGTDAPREALDRVFAETCEGLLASLRAAGAESPETL